LALQASRFAAKLSEHPPRATTVTATMMLSRLIGKLVERRAKLLLQNYGLPRAEILDPAGDAEDAIAEGAQFGGS
jgi:hypothetical protein